MQSEHIGEELMTDYQFQRYEEYRDKCETLEKELAALRAEKCDNPENGMTDYQFKYTMELKDENAALKKEIAMLRAEQENKWQEPKSQLKSQDFIWLFAVGRKRIFG